MKRIISAILIVAISLSTLLLLTSCKEKSYKPVESTAEEKRVVMTLEADGKSYEVKYELYRALFLSLSEQVDGGDKSVWQGENKDEYIKKIDALILERVAGIYSTFAVCEKIGIDVYSKEFDESVKEYIRLSVDGGYVNSIKINGFGGDYDKYLEHIKSRNLNCSVVDLMLRWSFALEKIETYYAGNINSSEFLPDAVLGAIKYTKEDIQAFYDSEDCVRIVKVFLNSNFTPTRAKEIRDKMNEKGSKEDIVNYAMQFTTTGLDDGIIGMHSLNSLYYSELTKTAFSLSVFEVSEPIEVITAKEDGHYIMYRAIKELSHFEECYEDIVKVYLQNEIGKILNDCEKKLLEEVKYSNLHSTLNRAEISMD